MRIAINGFGRIGKSFLRTILADKKAFKTLEVAVINVGKGDTEATALAFKYDTLMGTYPGSVSVKENVLHIDSLAIPLIRELDPEKAPWKKYGVDWVVEASGHFTKREGAQKHITAGAKHVLITAPAEGEDITVIPGVNHSDFEKGEHRIVSLGSCTSNALYPILKVLNDDFEIEQAYMTTIHSYTNTQPLLDVDPSMGNLRKGRAAALNIIPSTTGATKIIDRIMPELSGKLTGCSIRVPVGKVSLIDLTTSVRSSPTREYVNELFAKAADGDMKGILGYTDLPLVSSDYSGNNYSVVVDSLMTEVVGSMIKVFGWYDNEWGYAERLKDFLVSVKGA